MKEIWKSIEGYEGLYEISNLGRVKSLARFENGHNANSQKRYFRKEKFLKQGNVRNYLVVCLLKNGKRKMYRVHRLVALAFIPNPNNYSCVNHKDENPLNNCVDNLEWCSFDYNCNYGTRNERMSKSLKNCKSTSKPIRCVETGIIYQSEKEIERQLGFCQSHISGCCKHKKHRNTAYGYHWEFV